MRKRSFWRLHVSPALFFMALGAVGGCLLGASGFFVFFFLLFSIPILFVIMLGTSLVCLVRCTRRMHAGVSASAFALALGVAQCPFTAWRLSETIQRHGISPGSSIFAVSLFGLSIAPIIIYLMRRELPDLLPGA